MNTGYDDKLTQIDWFKIHKELLPFVGDNYDKYRILQIGESHYIDRTKESDQFDINYFDKNWWTTSCKDLVDSFNDSNRYNGCWFDTRRVLSNYLTGNKSRAYDIFNNSVKSFSKIILNKEISQITSEDKQLYNNFAFMNFFQMPSLYSGERYWKSLLKSANNRRYASKVFRQCVEISIKAIDDVIDILKPNIVVFTSVSAADAYSGKEYKECIGKYVQDERMTYTSHPSTRYWENCNLRESLGGKPGKYILEEKLAKLGIL